jgi:ubiquinone/menaquinone biosynthesis C-methylase UbiE
MSDTRKSRQTRESLQLDFDRIALVANEEWNNNEYYHDYLLAQVPQPCRQSLEIGCGTGKFSRSLARLSEHVLSIDLSPQMIRLARETSHQSNIAFVEADVLAYPLSDDQFDYIATLTTLHHLPFESILGKIKQALKPGGVFVCLDLYQRSSLNDLFFDGIAYPSTVLLQLIKTGKPRPSREIREAYAEHEKTDQYLTLSEVEQVCARVLPGASVKRHLFWRYSVVWRKMSDMV